MAGLEGHSNAGPWKNFSKISIRILILAGSPGLFSSWLTSIPSGKSIPLVKSSYHCAWTTKNRPRFFREPRPTRRLRELFTLVREFSVLSSSSQRESVGSVAGDRAKKSLGILLGNWDKTWADAETASSARGWNFYGCNILQSCDAVGITSVAPSSELSLCSVS